MDVTNVTFIDTEGQALLAIMWWAGEELHGTGCLTKAIVGRIVARGVGHPLPRSHKTEGVEHEPTCLLHSATWNCPMRRNVR